MAVSNKHKVLSPSNLNIIGLSEDLTPDTATDYLATYDASAGTNKRVLLDNLGLGGGGNAFTIIQPDAGTAPTADSSTDTLTLTSSNSSVTITGNSTTDTIDLVANQTLPNCFKDINTDAGTTPIADSPYDALTLTSSDASITITGNSGTDTVDFVVATSGDSFTTMATDAGTSPVADSSTDTLTFTSSDSSITITGNSTTDTIDFTGAGDVVGPSSSVDNTIARFDGTTGKLIQGYTSGGPTISDTGVASFNDPSYASSERIGADSTVGSTSATAFGKNADANGNSSVSIGANCTATSYGSIAIGGTTLAYGNYSISIGLGATTNNNADSIALGRNATCKQANSIVIGSYAGAVKNMFLGEGESTNLGSYADVSIQPTNPITVTNTTGADFLLKGSGSTGNVAGGSVKVQTQVATGASGTGTNATWEDMIEANGSKEVILNAEDSATADASLWTNSISFYLDETGNTLVVKAKYGAGTVKTGTVALT